jgi:hypothetical protein
MHIFFHCNQEGFLELQKFELVAPRAKIYFIDKDENQGMFRFIN